MGRPAVQRAATVSFAVVATASFVVATYLGTVNARPGGMAANFGLVWLLAGPLPFFLVGAGARLFVKRCGLSTPLLWVGGMFGIAGAVGFGVLAADRAGAPDGWLVAGVVAYHLSCMIAIMLLARTTALLPDGRSRYGYERVIIRSLWAVPLLSVIIFLAGPTAYVDHAVFLPPVRPVPVPAPELPWLAGPVIFLYQYYWLAVFVGVALFLVRVVRMPPAERRMVRVIAVALVLIMVELSAVAVILNWLGLPVEVSRLPATVFGVIPFIATLAAVLVTGLRHGLLGGRIAVRRQLLYGALWIAIAGAYLGSATVLGLAASARLPVVIALVVTVLATIMLEPVRRRVNRIAERQLLGRRLSGYEVLVRMGGALEHAAEPAELAGQLAAGLRDGLGLGWARVRLAGRTAVAGNPDGAPAVQRPVRHGDHDLGLISCGAKPDGAFAPRDLELVETLARQVALALHNASQTAELESSRNRLVQAQDAERRRIERDLHDGVQQELVALLAKLGLVRSSLVRDPVASQSLIEEVRDEAVRIVDELRELAHGIHPSVLTDEGLVSAVESSARRMPIPVRVSTTAGLRDARFAVTVEESAYYFVTEALTNVLKHAVATRAAVSLTRTDGVLEVEVRDNGTGLPAAVVAGGGPTALRDRVEAIGGSVRVGEVPGGGASVRAGLPVGGVQRWPSDSGAG